MITTFVCVHRSRVIKAVLQQPDTGDRLPSDRFDYGCTHPAMTIDWQQTYNRCVMNKVSHRRAGQSTLRALHAFTGGGAGGRGESVLPRGRVCRIPPRVTAFSPSSTSFFSLSFQMSSSSWLGAVPISPGWINPGNRTPAQVTCPYLSLYRDPLRHSKI